MQRILAIAVLALVTPQAILAQASGNKASQKSGPSGRRITGFYEAEGGAYLDALLLRGGKVKFQLTGYGDANLGAACGTLPVKNGVAVYRNDECEVKMVFAGKKVTASENGQCDIGGNHVTANGVYVKRSSRSPRLDECDPDESGSDGPKVRRRRRPGHLTGTYSMRSSASRDEFTEHKTLRVVMLPGSRMSFFLDAAFVWHHGRLSGIAQLENGTAVYKQDDCEIKMRFLGHRVILSQHRGGHEFLTDNDCGDVWATPNDAGKEVYVKRSSRVPQFKRRDL